MKIHTENFKNNIKALGRELNSKITYKIDGVEYELSNLQLNSITPHYKGAILKSVMKQLDIDTDVEIPAGTVLNYQLGVKIDEEYEYISFGNYVVYSVEKQEDTKSFKIIAYDKMLYTMQPYEKLPIEYPITIRDYINAICVNRNLVFKNVDEEFVNYNKVIQKELYLDEDGNNLDYTFRDVLDELAQVTASTICINEETDELEVRYIQNAINNPNLFDIADETYTTQHNQSMTFDNGIATVSFSGTTNFGILVPLTVPLKLEAGKSYTRKNFSGRYPYIVLRDENNNTLDNMVYDDNGIKTYTPIEDVYVYSLYFWFAGNREYDEIKPKMIEGTVEPETFEDEVDTIDERYLKDINVNFGEKAGPINTIVFSRSAGSDKITLSQPTDLPDEQKKAIEISDNQILNFNDRDLYLQDILTQLYGLEYYINDFSSTGICYYNLCDEYNIQIGENIYNCIMLNDEVNITQGLQETIYTDLLEGSDTDYSKTDKTDRTINQTTLIVDKQGREIEALVNDMYNENGLVNESFTRITQNINEINTSIQTAGGVNLLLNSVMFAHDENGVQNWNITGSGTIDFADSSAAVLAGGISGHVFVLNDKKVIQRIRVKIDSDDIPEDEKTYYTFSTKIKKDINGTCYVKIFNSNEEYIINVGQGESPYFADYEITSLLPKDNYYDIEFYGSAGSNATFTDNMFTIGTYKKQWTQANGEILNTQVNLGINGVSVKSATSEGTETNITPFEFAGYTMINGVRTKVFTLNGDTTEVEKIKSKKEISMPPLKIVPITTGNRKGWAFVPTGGDN